MLKLLDIPKGWFAQFMFRRALDTAARQMENQSYMQGRIRLTTFVFDIDRISTKQFCLQQEN